MRTRVALLAAGLLLGGAAQPIPEESRAVLTALLAGESAERGDQALCVTEALAPPSEHGLAGAALRRIAFAWSAMPRPADGARLVDPSLAARLNQLLGDLRGARLPKAGMAIDAGMVPAPFRLGFRRGCETLSLSGPAIVGDFAFVERSFHCGPRCGRGSIVALQRRARGWAPIAVAQTWIS